ncbi:MAG: hypothetical protein U0559_01775 [Anaerolineae bacterium]
MIGVNSTNTQLLPNGWSGVAIMLGAHSNIIGSGTGNNLNLISHSTRYGVYIAGKRQARPPTRSAITTSMAAAGMASRFKTAPATTRSVAAPTTSAI